MKLKNVSFSTIQYNTHRMCFSFLNSKRKAGRKMRLIKRIIKKTFSLAQRIVFSEKRFLYKANKRMFMRKMMDPSFDWRKYSNEYNPYYLKWGYKFPMYEFEYYAKNTGVKSDLYLPIRFYQRYIFLILITIHGIGDTRIRICLLVFWI